jgi:hypothetical protein
MCRIFLLLGYLVEGHDSPQREDPNCTNSSRSLKSFYYQVIRKCIIPTHWLCVFKVFCIDICTNYYVMTI